MKRSKKAKLGIARRKKRYAEHFQELHGISVSRKHRQANRISYLVARAKRRAKENDLPFDLAVADLELPSHCPILGIALDYVNVADDNPSLDRVRNELGYVKGNVRVISRRANVLKSRCDADTFRRIADYIEGKL